MKVEAYKSKTLDGYWDYVVDTLSDVTDTISDCGYPYVSYSNCVGTENDGECPMCRCSRIPGKKGRWDTQCARLDTQAKCTRSSRISANCEWVCP